MPLAPIDIRNRSLTPIDTDSPTYWKNELEGVVISAAEIDSRVGEIAQAISTDYGDRALVMVTVMNGALAFTRELQQKLLLRPNITWHNANVRNYEGTKQVKHRVVQAAYLPSDIAGKTVIIVEDIVDTGYCLDLLIQDIRQHGPEVVKVAVLIDKPERRQAHHVDEFLAYTGFLCHRDRWVVGYGLDLNGRYRSLPFVATPKQQQPVK